MSSATLSFTVLIIVSCTLTNGVHREPRLRRRPPESESVVLPPLEEQRSYGTETLKLIRGARPVMEAVALAATDCHVAVNNSDPSKLPDGVEAINQKGSVPKGTVVDLKCVENFHLMVRQLKCYVDSTGKGVWRHLDATEYARPVCEGCKDEDVDHGVPPGLLPRGARIEEGYFQFGDFKLGQKLPLRCDNPSFRLMHKTAVCVDSPDGPVWMADATTPLPDPLCLNPLAPAPAPSPPKPPPVPPPIPKATSQPVPPQPPSPPPTRPPPPVPPARSTPTPAPLSSCPSPKIDNGDVKFNKSHAEYSCSGKFKLQGPKERKCSPNGLWSGEDPKCVPTDGATCCHGDLSLAVLLCVGLGIALH